MPSKPVADEKRNVFSRYIFLTECFDDSRDRRDSQRRSNCTVNGYDYPVLWLSYGVQSLRFDGVLKGFYDGLAGVENGLPFFWLSRTEEVPDGYAYMYLCLPVREPDLDHDNQLR